MIVYELTHLFFRYEGDFVYSPKDLGVYHSPESIQDVIRYYSVQPGFCDNTDAFSSRERTVCGNVVDDTVFEVLVYLHSDDYKFEAEIELGLYGDEATAQLKLAQYCENNARLIDVQNLIAEKIINKCIIGRKLWPEGFSVD